VESVELNPFAISNIMKACTTLAGLEEGKIMAAKRL